MTRAQWLVAATRLVDVLVIGSGAVTAAWSIGTQVGAGTPHLLALVTIALIVVMSRSPLVLNSRAGDAVIGFEVCVLVFLVCLYPPTEALAVWSVGMIIANGTHRMPLRIRLFNTGLTITGGALLVGVVAALREPGHAVLVELAIVVLACAVYFGYDVLLTATLLALDAGQPLSAGVQWRTMPLGLACFVAVDTIGYLGVVLERQVSSWMLLLLLVPIGTILLAVRAVSRAHLSEHRLTALFGAAAQAHDWGDEASMEAHLVAKATAVLRHTQAQLRTEPPGPGELGCTIDASGAAPRYLVVCRSGVAEPFDQDDARALEALASLAAGSLDRHRLTHQMARQAGEDPLTGLANRRVFADQLDRALLRRPSVGVAVLFCDLDGFKAVNDRYGHDAGDELLRASADRLRSCLRAGDVLARLGGDEFAVLLPEVTRDADALQVAAAIHDAVANRFLLTGGEAQIGVSIGVAFSAATTSGADVLRNADTAMYRAKALGKGRTEQFEPLMRVDLLNRLELEEQLRLAVDARALTVAFQPIVDLSSGVIDGFEALARWTHPTLGSIPPDVFIPMAERLGVIAALDDHILVTAHAQMRRLMQRTGISLTLSVNIAPSQVGDPALLDCVRSLIASEPAMRLILELTEESLLADDPDTLEALRQLTDTGARLAVDDFGVGYSSIGYLHRLPVDRIKIDKSLVQDLAVRRSYLLVQGVVAMARAMDLQVVVEGIEDVHTAVLLRDLGCQRAQGYLFSPPVDLAAAEFLLRQGVTSAWAASPALMAPARARSA